MSKSSFYNTTATADEMTSVATSATNAATSATQASTSASNASTSETNASNSATAAANSATAAASSATTASGHATTASTQAGNSSSSASTASGHASTATTKASEAATSAQLADDYAVKVNGVVTGSDYSSKAHAVGGTGIDNGVGSSKDWAIKTSGTVGNSSDYSAKYYATQGNVGAVAGAITNINNVAGALTNINAVAGDATDIGTVAGQSTQIGLLGTTDAVSDMNALANITSDISALAGALEQTYTTTVAGGVFVLGGSNNPAIEMFRGSSYTFNQDDATNDGHPLVFKNGSSAYEVGVTYYLNGSATTQSNYINTTTFNAGRSSGTRKVVIEVQSTAPSTGLRYYCYIHGNGMGNTITVKDSNISLVATSIANVNLTGGSIANVNSVAGNATNINAVASNATNINAVNSNSSNINTVAGDTTEINAVSSNATNINAVANNSSNINTVAGDATEINAVAGNSTNINAVAGNATNINAVAGNSTNINAVNSNSTNINAVAGNATNINTVAGAATNVNTVATNLSSINDFADKYRIGSSDPGSSNDEGDLFYNTSSNVLKVYTGSAWEAGVTAGSGFAPIAGASFTGDISFPDNVTAKFGASNDLQISHNGNNSVIKDAGNGNLSLQTNGNNINLWDVSNGQLMGQFDTGGGVNLHHNGTKKFNTTSTGIDVTGTVTDDGATHDGDVTFTGDNYNVTWDKSDNALKFADNAKIKVGTGDDLEITHNGNNSFITDTGVGNLYIQASNNIFLRSGNGVHTYFQANKGGAVDLYHNNSKKFETTSTGIDVTGNVMANSFSIDHASNDWNFELSGADLVIKNGSTTLFKLDTSGNLTVAGDITTDGSL